MNYTYTILYVKDVSKSIEFYENAFGFKRVFIAPANEYGELDTGNTRLCFASIQLAHTNLSQGFIESKPEGKPFGIELGFTTPDVEEALKTAILAGAIVAENPKTKPWGQTVAYVKDIDGFLIEICTPVA